MATGTSGKAAKRRTLRAVGGGGADRWRAVCRNCRNCRHVARQAAQPKQCILTSRTLFQLGNRSPSLSRFNSSHTISHRILLPSLILHRGFTDRIDFVPAGCERGAEQAHGPPETRLHGTQRDVEPFRRLAISHALHFDQNEYLATERRKGQDRRLDPALSF